MSDHKEFTTFPDYLKTRETMPSRPERLTTQDTFTYLEHLAFAAAHFATLRDKEANQVAASVIAEELGKTDRFFIARIEALEAEVRALKGEQA